MLRIVYVFTDIYLSLIGERRLNEFPLGLRTMCERAFTLTNDSLVNPHTLVFGKEPDPELRAKNGVMQCAGRNQLIKDLGSEDLTNAWASFLLWHDWWSAPHWTNRATDDGDYFAQCTDCGKTTEGKTWPEKCSNGDCPSHMNWHTVNGVGAS